MTPPFEGAGAWVRRNRFYMALGASPFALLLAAIVAAIATGNPVPLTVTPHLLFIGLALTFTAWRKNHKPRNIDGQVRADEKGVWFGGELLVPKEQIVSGLVLPRYDGGPIVRFRRKGLRLPVEVRVADREEARALPLDGAASGPKPQHAARALLRALGLDASQTVAKFRLPSRAFADPTKRRRWGAIFAAIMVSLAVGVSFAARALPGFAPVFPFVLALAALGALVLAAIPTKLEVGADGLHIQWLRTARFVGYGEITNIDPYEDPGNGKNALIGLMLTLKSGETVRIPIMNKRSTIRDEVLLLHERISEAIDTWRHGEGVAHAALVRRGGREASKWVQALRGIGAFANADARTAPVMPEKLWRIVEDPAAPADARAGAAVALGQTADEEARSRLRAAASATAAPKLRFAIEAAAKAESDEAMAAALAELESDDASAQRA